MNALHWCVTDCLGWTATTVFVGSYFLRQPAALRGIQMFGAALWILYGLLIAAEPVIAANVLVFAAWTLIRDQARGAKTAVPAERPAPPGLSASAAGDA